MHVFPRDTRAYYALERLWGDAPPSLWIVWTSCGHV